MKTDRPKRGKKAAKRLDLTDIKHVLRDERQWVSIGVVTEPEDGSQYYRVVPSDDGSSSVDILVEVVLHPQQKQVSARLNAGIWMIPALGEEVAVVIPDGRVDFMPTIVAILSSNVVPTGTDAPTPTTIVLCRATVLVTDGHGGTSPVALKSDVDNLAAYVDKQFSSVGHVHTAPSGGGPTTATSAGSTASGGTSGVPTAAGTLVLKAK